MKSKKLICLLVFFGLFILPVSIFSQTYNANFQRTTGGNGYFRSIGNVGLIDYRNVYAFCVERYSMYIREIVSRDGYPSVIQGNIWLSRNIINVPDSIMQVMLNTFNSIDSEAGEMHEFIFPYESGGNVGYLLVLVYGQETWGHLDCIQAWFIILNR